MENHLRNKIEVIRRMAVKIDTTPLGLSRRSGGKMDLATSLNCDLLRFIMCLAAGDGNISEVEADIIRKNLGYNVTAEQVAAYIEKNAVTSADFMEKIPLTVRVLAEADVKIKSMLYRKEMEDKFEEGDEGYYLDEGKKSYVPSSIILRDIFKSLGQALIFSDAVVTSDENDDYMDFLDTMDNYLKNTLNYSDETFADKLELLARGGRQHRREGAKAL